MVWQQNKARTYPELSGADGRARLFILAAEVGRWSEETRKFLGAFATAKAGVYYLGQFKLWPTLISTLANCYLSQFDLGLALVLKY